MNHLTEDELILHYYGEAGDALAVEAHLDECGDCRERYGAYQRVLNVVDSLPVPERQPGYEGELWGRLAPRLGARRRFSWPVFSPWKWAAASAALAGLLTVAFVAGRYYPRSYPVHTGPAAPETLSPERVMLAAVGDYLERSQMVLIELANARPNGPMDISTERERARDLVSENRLYRQTAEHTGDRAVSDVLDELDRVLLEIAHSPAELSSEQLDHLRQRFESQGILFKIRVLGSNVRNQEGTAGANHL